MRPYRPQSPSLLLLTVLVGVGCREREPNSPSTDGSWSDIPIGDSDWDPPPQTTIRVSAPVLDFGTVDIGSISTAQVVTVTVSGAPVGLTPTVIGAGFAISSTTCTNPQPPGTCTVSVRFSPATIGAASGALSVGTAAVALAGAGMSHTTRGTTDRIDLGTVQINQTAPVVVPITAPSATGVTCTASSADLTLTSQTCPSSGPVSAPCTFTFSFKASTAGTKSEAVVCSSDGRVRQTTVTATVVTGASLTINPPAAVLTASVGGSYLTSFRLANSGDSPSGELTTAITAGASDFIIVSNECTAPLAPLAICRIQVAFKPATIGAKTGTLSVTDKASGQSATAVLTGTGGSVVRTSITPLTYDFGSVTVGATKTFSFTMKNSGGVATDVIDIGGGSSDFVIDGRTCKGFSVAAGSQCTFAVTFAPTSAGYQIAAIVLTEAGVAKATAQVSGTAVAAVLDAGTDAGTLDSNPGVDLEATGL